MHIYLCRDDPVVKADLSGYYPAAGIQLSVLYWQTKQIGKKDFSVIFYILYDDNDSFQGTFQLYMIYEFLILKDFHSFSNKNNKKSSDEGRVT